MRVEGEGEGEGGGGGEGEGGVGGEGEGGGEGEVASITPAIGREAKRGRDVLLVDEPEAGRSRACCPEGGWP